MATVALSYALCVIVIMGLEFSQHLHDAREERARQKDERLQREMIEREGK